MSNNTKKKTGLSPVVELEEYLIKQSPLYRASSQLIVKNQHTPLEKYNKIMNKLYLGNINASKDVEFFKNKNIKAVLNCSKDIPNSFINDKDKNIEYLRIPVDDSLQEIDFEKMYKYMPKIVNFIDKHISKGNNILVHCYAGRQRSAISVAGYLTSKRKMSPKQACKFILERRPEAFHYGTSLNFSKSLQKFYEDISKKNKI